MKFNFAIAAVMMSFFTQQSLAQTTTTLNFDTLADETIITSQYSAQGVNISGANATNAAVLGFVAHSGTQVAYSPAGLITMSLSIANVKTVSAYVTGPKDVGIYAYDAANNLLAQALLPANAAANTLLSVTSSGAAITKIAIHDGGASFAIDDVSFTTAAPVPPPVPTCRSAAEDAYNLIAALPISTAYVRSKTATLDRLRLLLEVTDFEKARASGKASQKILSLALLLIQADVKLSVKSPQNQPILQKLDQINSLIKTNSCQ
jgi:hypothetical protein